MINMKKFVLKLDLNDVRDKRKALKIVSSIQGIDSISMDMNEMKLTVVGMADPVSIVTKLRKYWKTDLVSVGPAKEPEPEKKEEPKPEEPKVEETKEEEPKKEEEKKEDDANKENLRRWKKKKRRKNKNMYSTLCLFIDHIILFILNLITNFSTNNDRIILRPTHFTMSSKVGRRILVYASSLEFRFVSMVCFLIVNLKNK